MVEEALDLAVRECDAHHGSIPGIVRAIVPGLVHVVVIAQRRRALIAPARRRPPANERSLQFHRVTTEHLVGACRDAVLRPFDNLDAQCRIEGAAEVVGDREGVVVDAGLVEDDVAVVRVKILTDDAGTGPEGAVRVQADGRREGGHSGNQRGVQVQSPLEDVTVVDGQVVHHGKRPGSIQGTPHEITEVALRVVDAGIGNVVVLGIARIVRVGQLRPIAVVVDVRLDVRVRGPAVIITRSRDVGSIVHGLAEKTAAATVRVTHQRDGRAIRAGDRQIQVPHVAVLHVHRHRQQVITVFQGRPILEEVEVQFTRIAETRTICEVGLPCHHLGRKGGPGHALHRISIHECRASRAHRSALYAVEQWNRAHQHLQRLQVQGHATVVIDHGEIHDILPGLRKAVGDIRGGIQRIDGAVIEIPHPILQGKSCLSHGTGIPKRHRLIEAHPDAERVRVRERRVDDGTCRGRSGTGRRAGDVGLPAGSRGIARAVVLEDESQATGRVVDGGRDGQPLQRIARVVSHGRGTRIGTIVNEQIVTVVGVRVRLEPERHEINRNSVSRIVRTQRVGEIFVGVRISGTTIVIARIHENARTGVFRPVGHDKELSIHP